MNRIRLAAFLVMLAFSAGCQQASYVDRIDRATIHGYRVTGDAGLEYIEGLRPLTNGQAYYLSREQWYALKTYARLNADNLYLIDAWAQRFAPAAERPSRRATDLAKSMVPQN